MKVLLDGKVVGGVHTSLGDGLRAGVEAAEQSGRVIVEAYGDGQPLPDEVLTGQNPEPGMYVELKLTSANPQELVRQTLLDASEAVEQARGHQTLAAERIHAGSPDQAIESIQAAMVTWQLVRDVAERTGAVLAMVRDTSGMPSVETAAGELTEHLGALRDALGNQDWSAAADVLAYDLDAQVTRWGELLRAMAAKCGAGGSAQP